MLHVRYNDESYDFDVDVDPSMSNSQVIELAAQQLDLAVDELNNAGLAVDRRPSGEVMVRPEAVYG